MNTYFIYSSFQKRKKKNQQSTSKYFKFIWFGFTKSGKKNVKKRVYARRGIKDLS